MSRVATWNVNYRGPSVAAVLGRLLERSRVDLVLVQEANASSLDALAEAAGLDWAVSAFDAGAPIPASRSGRHRVAALAGRGERPRDIGVLADLALPERMVFASLRTTVGLLTVASYHAPPGVSWGSVKVDHAQALLRWVNATRGPIIVGADANTPEIDHPDRELVRTHWHTGIRKLAGAPGDDATFGGFPRHRFDDAYRRWVDAHPDELDIIRRERPNGPLAVSHRTGKRRDSPGFPRRFDALWVGPEFEVQSISYDYEGAIAAGSDHALVVADLSSADPRSPSHVE